MTSTFEVRQTRPDEWLRELALDVADGSITDKIIRLSVENATAHIDQLYPNRLGDHRPLHHTITAHWLQAGYVARGQAVKLFRLLGLHRDLTVDRPAHNTPGEIAEWMRINRETSDREQELIRLLRTGVEERAGGYQIRTGGLHGEDPAWRAGPEVDIGPAEAATICITCIRPIYFANGQWRHQEDDEVHLPFIDSPIITRKGRDEAYIESPCRRCGGTMQIESPIRGRDPERCPDCRATRGRDQTLHHLADPEIEGRKI